MQDFKLSELPMHKRLFVTSLICFVGLVYCVYAFQIWISTEFNPEMISESYGYMEYMELTEHAHIYLPYYGIFCFAIPLAFFMFTGYNDKLKSFLSVFTYILIPIDISLMYLIPYVSTAFSTVLVIVG
ncbi:hypothetical protein ACFL5H_04415, partial [Candidatus Latescibacterota bacterium]